jgi:hypothetical protein
MWPGVLLEGSANFDLRGWRLMAIQLMCLASKQRISRQGVCQSLELVVQAEANDVSVELCRGADALCVAWASGHGDRC